MVKKFLQIEIVHVQTNDLGTKKSWGIPAVGKYIPKEGGVKEWVGGEHAKGHIGVLKGSNSS